MFNSGLKKEWLARLESTRDEYINEMNVTQEATLELFEVRNGAVTVVKQIENFINSIANTPKEYEVTLQEINLKLQEFNELSI